MLAKTVKVMPINSPNEIWGWYIMSNIILIHNPIIEVINNKYIKSISPFALKLYLFFQIRTLPKYSVH